MTTDLKVNIPPMEGAVAYPRKNGEPVFEAPWQSRAFGMVVDLHTQGMYLWDDFKERLIHQIGKDDEVASRDTVPPVESGYYAQWVEAFSRLLVDKGMVSQDEMTHRVEEFKTGLRQQVY